MSRYWIVIARRITRTPDGWTGSEGVPTFFLDENMQGIVGEAHAEKIARNVLGEDLEHAPHITYSVSVARAEV